MAWAARVFQIGWELDSQWARRNGQNPEPLWGLRTNGTKGRVRLVGPWALWLNEAGTLGRDFEKRSSGAWTFGLYLDPPFPESRYIIGPYCAIPSHRFLFLPILHTSN